MTEVTRYLFMFDNGKMTPASGIVATASGVFPTHRYEYQQEQPLLASSVALAGANYAFDQLGGAAAVKGNGVEVVRFLDVGAASGINADVDAFKAMQSYGRGRIWTQVAPASGQRWAWARLAAMPSLSFTVEDASVVQPVFVTFERSSDWYGDPIGAAGLFTLSSNPQTITVTNPGTAPVNNAIITVKGTFNGDFAGLVITNTTTGYVLTSGRVGSASSHWLRFDAGANTVRFSSNSGATWTDDWANFTRTGGQVGLMVMAPGANSITIKDANGADVVFDLAGAWD